MSHPLSFHRRLSLAPMMGCTDRHFRYLCRLLSKHTLLYTEMFTTGALLYGDAPQWLDYNACEHPVAFQLGGSDPKDLAASAKLVEQWGYDEVNLNVGCPSDRVQAGMMGACLMEHPKLVGDCVVAMQKVVSIPVTVKCRIGIDHHEFYESLQDFVKIVSEAGCKTFIIHARKAWLKGLNPKQNRTVPPLKYDWVHRIKQDFPELHISINGGINTLAEANEQLQSLDGVMMGRALYNDPFMLAEADEKVFGASLTQPTSRTEVFEQYKSYMEEQHKDFAVPLSKMTKHATGLFNGQPGAKAWRIKIANCEDLATL